MFPRNTSMRRSDTGTDRIKYSCTCLPVAAFVWQRFALPRGRTERLENEKARDRTISCFFVSAEAADSSFRDTKRHLSSGDLSGTQTTGANSNGLGCAVNDCSYLADVGLPGSVRLTVRVGNCLSENNAFSADATFCHIDTSLYALSRIYHMKNFNKQV